LSLTSNTLLRRILVSLVNIFDRTDVHVSTTEQVIDDSEDNNESVSQYSPIHVSSCWVRHCRPEGEGPKEEQKYY
jgi:hypothetical protein